MSTTLPPSLTAVSNNEPSFIRSSTSLVNSSNELDVYEEVNSYIDRENTKIRRAKSVDILDEIEDTPAIKPRSRSNSVIGLGGLPGLGRGAGVSPSSACNSIINDPLHEGLVYMSPGVSPRSTSPCISPRDSSPVSDVLKKVDQPATHRLQPRLLARLQKGSALFNFRSNKKAG